MTVAVEGEGRSFPPARRAWYVIALLALAYTFSMMDRFIPILMVEQLNAEFGLSDVQLGLLIGFGFAIVYAIAGLPLANLIDQGQRRMIVAAGIILWNAATFLSGLATSYEQLLALRMALAVGEAVLTPAAVSLIYDLFPANRRPLAMSIYAGVASLMGVGAFILGGAILALAAVVAPMFETDAWRMSFMLLGGPGVLLGLLFLFTVSEPARHRSSDGAKAATAGQFVAYYRKHWTFFTPLLTGVACASVLSFALLTWTPTVMVRTHDFPPATAGITLGLIIAPVTLFAVFAWPLLARRLPRGLILCLLIGSVGGSLAVFLGTMGTNLVMLLIALAVAQGMLSNLAVLTPLTIQRYGNSQMQARLTAVYIFLSNIIGQGLGPLSVPILAGLFGAAAMLETGLLITAAIVAPLVGILFWTSLRATPQDEGTQS